ncbi:hypothetical protein OQA88_12391 [Cercophora sp. LCS_1]
MPLDDDDVPTATPIATPSVEGGEERLTAEEALEEEVQDFRSFVKNTNVSAQTIRKGAKDFESVGTRKQEDALEQSRLAMQEVLSYTRAHTPQNWVRGWYFPKWWAKGPAGNEIDDDREEAKRRNIKEEEKTPDYYIRDRVVLLERSSVASMNLGRAVPGQAKDAPAKGLDWLLPEEALYLLERGSLDLWYPTVPLEEIFPAVPKAKDDTEDTADGSDDDEEYKYGVPLSLQAAYSLLIGNVGERGKISLQKFQVFSNLKRAGYNVLRAPPLQDQVVPLEPPATTLWQWLTSLLPSVPEKAYGPLVRPGLYRSYVSVYKQMALIPRHIPSPKPSSPWDMDEPFAIHFHIWKAGQKWTKLRHPPPNFYVSVVDAQDTDVPKLDQIAALIGSTPLDLPNPNWSAPRFLPARLKHGHRNALVAVVDHGIINYMRFAEGAFSLEPLSERADGWIRYQAGGKPSRGGKGGRGGRGGGRGGRKRGGR